MGDLPAVTVLDPCPAGGQAAVVEPGDDQIPDPGGGAVVQLDALGFDAPGFDEVGAGTAVEFGDHLAGARDHERAQALITVGAPRLVDRVEHRLGVALDQPGLFVVGVERLDVAVPQAEARGLLPLVDEAAHVGEFGHPVAVAHEHPERPTSLHGTQLRPVTDEDDLGPDLCRVRGDPIQRERAREGGLVHEHELPCLQAPASFGVFVEELRGVLGPDAEGVSEHFGCRR